MYRRLHSLTHSLTCHRIEKKKKMQYPFPTPCPAHSRTDRPCKIRIYACKRSHNVATRASRSSTESPLQSPCKMPDHPARRIRRKKPPSSPAFTRASYSRAPHLISKHAPTSPPHNSKTTHVSRSPILFYLHTPHIPRGPNFSHRPH
jgi:hypothetical protein